MREIVVRRTLPSPIAEWAVGHELGLRQRAEELVGPHPRDRALRHQAPHPDDGRGARGVWVVGVGVHRVADPWAFAGQKPLWRHLKRPSQGAEHRGPELLTLAALRVGDVALRHARRFGKPSLAEALRQSSFPNSFAEGHLGNVTRQHSRVDRADIAFDMHC